MGIVCMLLQKPFAPIESNRHLVTDKKLAMQTTLYTVHEILHKWDS